MPIPRIFHRIWVGGGPLPDEYREYGETWLRHHPGWEMRLWTDDDIPDDLVRPEPREGFRMPAERSDILRYELLLRYGGVYVDTDFECLRPIDELIEGVDFFTGDLKPGRVNNAIIGSVPGHPLLEAAVREARPVPYDDGPPSGPLDKTYSGSLFFAGLIERFDDVKVFPPEVFYPEDDQLEGAYARHDAARSWVSHDATEREVLNLRERTQKLQDRLDKTERRMHRLEKELRAMEATRWWRLREWVATRTARLRGVKPPADAGPPA